MNLTLYELLSILGAAAGGTISVVLGIAAWSYAQISKGFKESRADNITILEAIADLKQNTVTHCVCKQRRSECPGKIKTKKNKK